MVRIGTGFLSLGRPGDALSGNYQNTRTFVKTMSPTGLIVYGQGLAYFFVLLKANEFLLRMRTSMKKVMLSRVDVEIRHHPPQTPRITKNYIRYS